MKRTHVLTLALVAAGWLAFFGDTTSDSAVVKAVERSATSRPVTSYAQPITASTALLTASKSAISDPVLALQSRQTLIGGAHDGASTVLFGTQTWAPPLPPPVTIKPPPPPPPAAPPLPFTYLGKQVTDGKWLVFLARGEQTFIATEQLVIEGTYRVDAIVPPQLNLVYLPLQKMQTLQIGGVN